MMSLECCRRCVDDWRAWMDAAKATPIGGTVPHCDRHECENPDCALFDAMLARLKASHLGQLAVPLSRTREQIMSRGRP